MTDSATLLEKTFRQMRREKAERDVLIHTVTAELRRKLDDVAEKYGEVEPLAEVIRALVSQVAELQLQFSSQQEVIGKLGLNADLEREMLLALKRKLGD